MRQPEKVQKIKTHITVLLAGFFIFPVVYQSVHLVLHNSNRDKEHHHVCSEHAPAPDPLEGISSLSELKTVCPICEYEFSIKEIPEISVFYCNIPIKHLSYNRTAVRQIYKDFFSKGSTRAPPLQHS
jgi:hypothetical protein